MPRSHFSTAGLWSSFQPTYLCPLHGHVRHAAHIVPALPLCMLSMLCVLCLQGLLATLEGGDGEEAGGTDLAAVTLRGFAYQVSWIDATCMHVVC